MADELWIVRDDQSCGWCVDAKGKITTDDEYVTEGRERINIGVPDAPLTQKQADAIRGLICDLHGANSNSTFRQTRMGQVNGAQRMAHECCQERGTTVMLPCNRCVA